ncbi:MAG: glycine--tRNA ligase subunit beta [Gammaproteobacteria bacterium]
MADQSDLLIEIGTEELPPKALQRLSLAFAEGVRSGLEKAGLNYGSVQRYATPRRLAVLIDAVDTAQADRVVERRGPAIAAAFDEEGNPTKAATGFAGSCGVRVEDLETLESEKGAWLVYRSHQAGCDTKELVPEIVNRSLAALPIPKRMRWGDRDDEFVRPVHWVVMLLGSEVIDGSILGVASGRATRGHRFHHPEPISIPEAENYAPLLESEGRVMPDFATRREAIEGQVLEAALALGGKALLDDELLDEVTALVEWPSALSGRFDERFLEVPPEALISTMKGHQKYFPVTTEEGRLLPFFITVSNIESRDPQQVVAGNERVIRPRLSDAAFFWEQDRKQPLASRIDDLKGVVFQEKLGTLYDKAERISLLAGHVAGGIGGEPELARRAGLLAKCDLLTEMVGEFPELQGIMGRYYAQASGEPEEVAQAITEQYQPRFAGDSLPASKTGQALAVADRLDTLVGIFGIGQLPTGDKDPYALRRAALGVLRILIEKELDLDLEALLRKAATSFGELFDTGQVVDAVYDFTMDRLRSYYTEQGVTVDVFEAVLEKRPTRPLDFHRRLQAVVRFRELPAAESLAAANKRIRNILRKAEERYPDEVDGDRLVEPAEKELAESLRAMRETVTPLIEEGRYETALARLAELRETVDRFFDEVMVMTEETDLRRNRLALLAALSGLFLKVADLSQLQG